MNKKVFGRKLSRSRPAREALFASLARAMMLSGKIVTTRAKAKAVQPDLEKFVTLAKRGDLSGRRRILASLDNSKDALEALYKKIVPVFSARTSGFTRIISLPRRKGDNAQVVRMEWTETIIKNEELKIKNKKAPKKEEKVKKTVKGKGKIEK
ncbi:MAG: 50S ribosomal protein L17 [Candidatus Woesebacteria bacterium]|nr:MAG: 50S ribosomal protein L17 [Candidatus Woesebacteria bacterium]